MRLNVIMLLLWAAAGICGQVLEIKPRRVMADDRAVIRARGLRPNETIAIRAQLTDGAGKLWASEAEFVAGKDGIVDVSQQSPTTGSYAEISAWGLIWSMMPADNEVIAYRFPKGWGEQTVRFLLIREGAVISEAQLEIISLAEGVQRIPVREAEIRGVLFLPAGKCPCPAVLVLGGSEGGAAQGDAAWLAARGFVAFALAYFAYDDLPRRLEAIPLEYFGRALDWMTRRPEVKPDGIGVFGVSRGGELALQLGSMFPAIRCVVAKVPGNVRYRAQGGGEKVDYAWTWKGKPLPYVAQLGDPSSGAMRQAEIEVERTNGPILLISGNDDRLWPSAQMGDAVMARLKNHHFRDRFEHLAYPGAGHLAGATRLYPRWRSSEFHKHPITGQEKRFGGSARGDAFSSFDAPPKIVSFLWASLR